jgi:hypothetical protein
MAWSNSGQIVEFLTRLWKAGAFRSHLQNRADWREWLEIGGNIRVESETTARSATVFSLAARRPPEEVRFDRRELSEILKVYGRQVAAGNWRDYAISFGRDRAVFAILRGTGEMPLYTIVKDPSRAERQGAYAVIAQGGLILKRGHDLARVLAVLEKPTKVVG